MKKNDELQLWPLDRLKPYPGNPRKNDAAAERLAGVIREYGFRVPIVARSDGEIMAGHTRLKAAQILGLAEVPVLVADDLTPEQARAWRLADNASAGWAQWDLELLRVEVEELDAAGFDLALPELDDLLARFDVAPVPPPNLADGDRAPFRQVTFTLHDEQHEEVEAAIKRAKAAGGHASAVNENTNGNALAWICERFNRG